jgi:RNA polymerase sigma-70 factor (ECF subfamily)
MRAGSEQATTALFERHWPRAWRLAYTLVGSRVVAEDVAQDAFERAFGSIAAFDGRSAFATWLHRIVVNRALTVLRAAQWTAGAEPVDDLLEDQPLPDEQLRAAVAAMPLDRRIPLVLRYWLDYSPAEIAELLDVPVGTVHSRLARALEHLRTELEVPHVD